ncbi:LuxR C-terminal-related transcriptional regulator [Oryzihumus leptocrescens]|uniref:Putative ATPase n=1 Tax=Oryzihumus leptocrescens TaxID=297536 RepID=A0A542ZHA7_9MICO|nr:LuxR C-terminal-related transcriptional regulator [Oryzihumus leptocrescens]TQL59679.1 putative ATPase [Oryzihumus leptocrescens]
MSLEARHGNLPRTATALVGRAGTLRELAALVRSRQLVTLTGVGGVGKTRLALAVGAELAEEFPDGTWLVELAPVGNADAVPDAIATALGITPQGDARVIDTVAEAVAGRRLLILVDNCEHVLTAAAEAIAEILARSEVPRILATSREHLRAPGEALVPVSPLAVDGGMTSEAVTLFVERARAVRPGFGIFDAQTADAVVEICGTLDGLPLGIELAAARMAAMSAVEVRDRLGDRFRLLTGPELAPDRQATLRHAMAWSYDLLNDEERAALRQASVFAGGFDLAALCAVAESGDDVEVLRLLDSLVRKSLVRAHHGPARTRYSLFETIRAFADERLVEAAEREAARDRHAAHFADEAARRWGQWNGPAWRTQVDWVTTELANLRSGLQWSIDRGHVEVATDIAAHAALMGFSVELFETIGWAESLLDVAARADVPRLPRLYAAAGYACFVGRAAVATRNAHLATELEGQPGYQSCEPGYATFIEALGQVYCGNLDRYIELTRDVAALPGAGRAYGIAAYVDGLQSAGRVEEALELTGSAVASARQLANPFWVVYTLWIVGLAWSKPDPQRALETWDEGVAQLGEHDVRFFEGFLARDAALLHTSDGQLEAALTLFGTSIGAFLRSGAVAQLVITLASLPALFERLDRPAIARTLLGAMANEPASVHHVPTLADLGERLDAQLGDEASARFAAVGGGMDLHEASAYALHQIGLAQRALTASSQHGGGVTGLTARETQVLRLIADGATTREISERLFISAKTADNHIQHIYTKLGVTNRAAATRWALDREVVVRATETGGG